MKLSSVLKWTLLLVLLITLVIGGVGGYAYSQKDKLVEEQILQQFDRLAPDLQLTIGQTRLNGIDRLELRDIEIRERKTQRAVFRTQQLLVDIDGQLLLDRQILSVLGIRLNSADVAAIRRNDGRWNWQDYRLQPPERKTVGLPRIEINDLRVLLTLQHAAGIPPAMLTLNSPKIEAIPLTSQAFDIRGGVSLPGVGDLVVLGDIDLKTGKWAVDGRLQGVTANQRLFEIARSIHPDTERQVDSLNARIAAMIPQQQIQVAAADSQFAIGQPQQSVKFLGQLDLDIHAHSDRFGSTPDFKMKLGVHDGKLQLPGLPFAFHNVSVDFFKDNTELVVRLNRAEANQAILQARFRASTQTNAPVPTFEFDISRFPVNMDLLPYLPQKTQKLFRDFQPNGTVSVSGRVFQDGGQWKPNGVVFDVHDGSLLPDRFRYPITGITGQVRQRPFQSTPATDQESAFDAEDLVFDLSNITGQMGRHQLNLGGWFRNPGPTVENRLVFDLPNFELDGRFRNALDDKGRGVVESLDLQGVANVRGVFYRAPGLQKPTHAFLNAQVRDARLRFEKFPYDIEQLSGLVQFDGSRKTWTFSQLQGRHGTARIKGGGQFVGSNKPGQLNLRIQAEQAALDTDLYNSLPAAQRAVWDTIRPTGFCDFTTDISWVALPGVAPVIRFPMPSADTPPTRMYGGTIRPTPFPLPMRVQQAVLSFEPHNPSLPGIQHCEIHKFIADYKGAPITSTGWTRVKPNGEWQVHLNEVTAKNLPPDRQLRESLPESWHETLTRMKHQGTLSVVDSQLDFRGTISGDRNPTASWDLNLKLDNCVILAGQEVSSIFGNVTAIGSWDGYDLFNAGRINLQTGEVLEMPFTGIRGPYTLNNKELVLGARAVFERKRTDSVPPERRVVAQAYGGQVFIDAIVENQTNGNYQFFAELNNARLESYANLHIPDQQNLKGLVKAWMHLRGHGTEAANIVGNGQMVISPAALYELPVVVKLLGAISKLNLNVQDLTAFNYAKMDFRVRNQAFELSPVTLAGESISFVGQGIVGFSGAVDLDFYSRPTPSSLAQIPILRPLLTNWVKVEVRGTTDRPQTIVRPNAKLDDSLQQFLQQFRPHPNGPTPRLNVPAVLPAGRARIFE